MTRHGFRNYFIQVDMIRIFREETLPRDLELLENFLAKHPSGSVYCVGDQVGSNTFSALYSYVLITRESR